jgi:hypothetical protein
MTTQLSGTEPTRRAFLWQSFLALNTLYLYPAFAQAEANTAELSLKICDASTGEIVPCSVAQRTSTAASVVQERSDLRCLRGRLGWL